MSITQEYQRVVYGTNPLVEVICQLKFPTLLQIDATPPASFQSRIMQQYAKLEIRDAVHVMLSGEPDAAPLLRSKSYHFISDDGNWTITLASDFLALTAQEYVRWEDFRSRLIFACEAFLSEYQIAYFTRIGLRYRDIIDPTYLGLEQVPWSELIRLPVLGMVGADDLHGGNVKVASSAIEMTVDNVDIVINTGLLENNETRSKAFLIDTDFFLEGKLEHGVKDAVAYANDLHGLSGPVFRWCITERLHNHLKPALV